MNSEAEEDLQHIKDLVDIKYRAGNAEHNGDILNMTAVEYFENSIDEKIDDLVYTIKGLEEVKVLLKRLEES